MQILQAIHLNLVEMINASQVASPAARVV